MASTKGFCGSTCMGPTLPMSMPNIGPTTEVIVVNFAVVSTPRILWIPIRLSRPCQLLCRCMCALCVPASTCRGSNIWTVCRVVSPSRPCRRQVTPVGFFRKPSTLQNSSSSNWKAMEPLKQQIHWEWGRLVHVTCSTRVSRKYTILLQHESEPFGSNRKLRVVRKLCATQSPSRFAMAMGPTLHKKLIKRWKNEIHLKVILIAFRRCLIAFRCHVCSRATARSRVLDSALLLFEKLSRGALCHHVKSSFQPNRCHCYVLYCSLIFGWYCVSV